MKPLSWRANPDEETTDWRAVRGRTAHTVRRAGRALALSDPYPDFSFHPEVCCAAHQRKQLERQGQGLGLAWRTEDATLCRYNVIRPAIANERLVLNRAG